MSSKVWKYYKKKNERVQCTKCPQILACKGSSTSSLKSHLLRIHKIDIDDDEKEKNLNKVSSSQTSFKGYFTTKSSTSSLPEVLSRSVAEDGLSVCALQKSKVIKSYLKTLNKEMPCQATIWKHIYSFYEEKKPNTL